MIEICCGSYEDGMNAYHGGAKQIELNSALHLGGLTPSVASLVLLKKETDLKIICMVRPRGAGFYYGDLEYKQMVAEANDLLKNGADGIAFGFLKKDCSIDIERTKEMIELIQSYHKEVVFHRAFDCTKDPYLAIEQLIELGVTRVLTSGLEAKAMQGIVLLEDLQAKYGDRIQILAGSGMNATNIVEFMDKTKIFNIHSSCKDWKLDPTTSSGNVNYCFGDESHRNDYDFVSSELVERIMNFDRK